jgi:hypothetical protein
MDVKVKNMQRRIRKSGVNKMTKWKLKDHVKRRGFEENFSCSL